MHLIIFLAILAARGAVGDVSFKIIHKFSDEARLLGFYEQPWLRRGSLEYHRALHRHDLSRHARRRLESHEVALVQGNYTENLGSTFGGIHYSIVDIGTPNVTFLVALDTGSDLFWVPCDCQQCESQKFPELKMELVNFNSKLSNSSKTVSCGDNRCEGQGKLCTQPSSICPYEVNYLSANTSTSGTLLQDVIYLRNLTTMQTIQAPILFGCGQKQTGLFLKGGAPNGLLGLGPGPLSLPSLLANDGLIKDSFSMCFDLDSSGRLVFGDQGASNQQTTPFLKINGQQPAYFITVQEIDVGTTSATGPVFRALFDTGTTLTYLPTEWYNVVTSLFNNQVQFVRIRSFDPYEYCYKFEENQDDSSLSPQISLIFSGGAKFTVVDPFLSIIDSRSGKKVGVCLALLKGSVPIIGQNFMVGYRLSFDRELGRLGWIRANCYDFEDPVTNLAPAPRIDNKSSSTNERQDSPFLNPGEGPSSGASPWLIPGFLLACIVILLN